MSMIMSDDGLSLEEGLSHSDPVASCLARMSVSTFATSLLELLNAEAQRGTNPVALMHALARFQVQAHASLAAQFVDPAGIPHVFDLYELTLNSEYIQHAARARVTGEKMKGSR